MLAVTLLLQSGLALAHGMRGANGVLVELCSTDGIRIIRLDAQGEPMPETEGGFCPICLAPPGVIPQRPRQLALFAWFGSRAVWHASGRGALHPAARAPPYLTRAPPIAA